MSPKLGEVATDFDSRFAGEKPLCSDCLCRWQWLGFRKQRWGRMGRL